MDSIYLFIYLYNGRASELVYAASDVDDSSGQCGGCDGSNWANAAVGIPRPVFPRPGDRPRPRTGDLPPEDLPRPFDLPFVGALPSGLLPRPLCWYPYIALGPCTKPLPRGPYLAIGFPYDLPLNP